MSCQGALAKTGERPYEGTTGRLVARSGRLGVVGLGYVGLPLSVVLGRSAFRRIGLDTDGRKCMAVASRHSHIPDVPDQALRTLLDRGRLMFFANYGVPREADPIIICMPTPVYHDKRPDPRHILRAGEAIRSDASELAAALYVQTAPEVVTVSSTREAEMSALIGICAVLATDHAVDGASSAARDTGADRCATEEVQL